MNTKQNLLELVCKQNACVEGVDELVGARVPRDFINLYFRYIDFCLAKKIPNLDFVKANFSEEVLKKNDIHLSAKASCFGGRRMAFIGSSDADVTYVGYLVGRVYVADNSILRINARGNAFVVVDAIDKAEVHATVSDNAKVIINAYRDAEVSGNATIVRKNTPTYEL